MESNVEYFKKHYGKKYGEMVENYIKCTTHDDAALFCLDLYLDEEIFNKVKEPLSDSIKRCMEFTYFEGLRDGVIESDYLKNDKPTIKCNEKVLKKDFTIVYDFHDNDFGNDILEAAQRYVKKYNGIVSQINQYSDIEHTDDVTGMLGYKFEILNQIENISYVAKYLTNACYCERIFTDLDYSPEFCKKNTVDDFHNDAKDTVINYLGMDDTMNYVVGTYSEMEQYVMKKYERCQSKENGEGQNLKTCWFNGEVLFISMKDGEMKAWIQ